MSSLDTMARLFLIALVLVGLGTSWWWAPRGLAWRRERAAERARLRDELRGGPPGPEPGSLGEVIAEVQDAADAGRDEVVLVVPERVTIDRREASPQVVDVLLRDAIARSGYEVHDDGRVPPGEPDAGARRLVCRKPRTAPG